MSLPNYLANIKSSGVYRFVWDKSLVPTTDAETLRLVVGYSEKGPFNTPVYIRNQAEFVTTYGNISKRLERKGVYFHRMAIQALSAGPILALNIKPFKDETVSYLSFNPATITNMVSNNTLKVKDLYNTNRFWSLDVNKLSSIGENYITFAATDDKNTSCTVFIRRTDFNKLPQYDVDFNSWYANNADEMPEYLESIKHNKINQYFIDVYVFKGKFTEDLVKKNGMLEKYFKPISVSAGAEGAKTVQYMLNNDYKNLAFDEKEDVLEALAHDPNSNFLHSYTGCTIPSFKSSNGDYISIDLLFNSDYNEHKMLMKMDESKLEDSESVKTVLGDVLTAPEVINMYPIYVEGYDYKSILKSDKEAPLVTKILGTLSEERGIREALTNRVDVDYHYIIDTFDSYTGTVRDKAKLSLIAKEKGNVFAFINFPKLMPILGNDSIKKSKEKLAALIPGESEGASFCGLFTQVKFSDGTVKHTIPSASLVSNNFMEKYRSRQPYYIVAGPNYGVLSYSNLIGPDYNFSREDLDILEPMGVNAIIYVPRRGVFINSNQTAKQKPVTGLSKIHIRELVIFLQDEIEQLLQSYQWELNTQPLRDTIKSKADSILETVKNNGGVYEYLNICDESNNTPEVIDNEMVVLNTEIEPARGAGKMIHELTIYRTGELSSRFI